MKKPKLDRNDPNWPAKLTASTFGAEEDKFRFRLFGMAGSWDEYWYFANTKKALAAAAFDHLKFGHDAHIEDTKTGKVWTLRLKKRRL